MEKKTEDYNEYTASHDDSSLSCFAVQKIDCIQHVGKCFGAKRERIAKSKLLAGDGKSRNYEKGRLGQIARNKLRKYFTKVIKQHARPGTLTTVEQDDGATDLKRGLMTSLYHSLKINDLERRHQFCPFENLIIPV